MARCGECKFWQDFKKIEDYWKSPCCLVTTINYYQGDYSDRPKKAYLSVTENNGSDCKSFDRKIPVNFNEQAEQVPF